MAAPDYVPTDPVRPVRVYSSPPRRNDAWRAERPGDIDGPQPRGAALGTAGPDQGYAFRLVHQFEDRLHLGGVAKDDAVAGCVALAMKRAGLYGRAPVVHDLTAAFTIYGFLDASPPEELVAERAELFAEVRSDHHYMERRHLVDRVHDEILRKTHGAIDTQYTADWTKLFDR